MTTIKDKLNVRAEYLYLMLDQKSPALALTKVGLTADMLINRLCKYKTINPWLECVAICEIRADQNHEELEQLFHYYLASSYEYACGEWYIVKDKEEIEKLRKNGFNEFGKLVNRIKKVEMVNKRVCELWKNITVK